MRRIVAFALAVGWGCGRSAPTDPTETLPSSRATAEGAPTATESASVGASESMGSEPTRPMNVLLLSIDSLRADVPWQGYPRAIAPNLTELASTSAVYTRAYSVSSYTAKSVAALLAGRYPSQLYRSTAFFTSYSRANEFFPELLQANGVRTMAGHAHFYFERDNRLDQGFDVWRTVPGIRVNPQTDESVTSDKLTDLGLQLLSDPTNTKGPFFVWFHYMDPHDVYIAHAESPTWSGSPRDRYDSEVHFTDRHVGRLLAFARKQAWWERTVVILTADHGEAFGEHGAYRHAFALWEVLTRVPLVIHGPGIAPRRIDRRRSDIDLAPTIVDLLGVAPATGFVGKTLVPELFGREEPGDREPIVLDLPADSNNPPKRAIIEGRYKLLVEGEAKGGALFDLESDPGEEKDLSRDRAHASAYAAMRQRFEQTWASIPRVAPYGGRTIVGGGKSNGPKGPPGYREP